MKKMIMVLGLTLLLAGIYVIPTLAATQSVTGLPLIGSLYGVEYERAINEKTASFVDVSWANCNASDYDYHGYGVGVGNKYYFKQALDGGYLAIGGGYFNLIYNGNKPKDELENGIGIYGLIGYRLVFKNGFTLEGGIGPAYTTDGKKSQWGVGAKILLGYSW